MKNLALFAFAGLALAAPLEKRMVYETVYEEVVETVWTTTTVWVDPTSTPDASAEGAAGFYEKPAVQAPPAAEFSPSAAPEVKSPVPSSSAPAPYVAPPAPTPEPVAPVQTAPQEAPKEAPSSSPPAAPAAPAPSSYTPAPEPVTPAPVQSQPAPSTGGDSSYGSGSGSSSSGSQGDHTGEMTYYDVSVGTGSCGTTASNSDNVVALSHLDMNNGANPNANPLCGKTINIYYNGATHQAKVFDTCPTCAKGAIDIPQPLFDLVAPNGDGRVKGVSWSFA